MDSWTLVMLPILVGTAGMGCNQSLRRYFMRGKPISPLQLLIHLNIVLATGFGALYLLVWGFSTPTVLSGFWRAVALGSAVNLLIQFCSVKAASIDQGEVSFTAPLQAMTPGLITILALTLGEFPSKIGCLGIALMAAGSYLLLWEKNPEKWWEYWGPLKRLILLIRFSRLSPEDKNHTLVVVLSLGTACFGTLGLLFDGLYTRRGINLQGLAMASMVLFFLLAVGYAIWFYIRPDTNMPTRKLGLTIYQQKKYLLSLLGMVGLWLMITFTIQPTYNHTYVAYTGTLKRFSILMAVLIGCFILREKEFKKRGLAAMFIIAGAILISTDDLPSRISTQIQGWGL